MPINAHSIRLGHCYVTGTTQVRKVVEIDRIGRNEVDGPTDDLAVRIHLNDQEAGELSLKGLVGDHLHSVVTFAESVDELPAKQRGSARLANTSSPPPTGLKPPQRGSPTN